MAKKLGSSRLLVKIATGLDTFGEKGFEERLDNMLVAECRSGKKILDIKIEREVSITEKANAILRIVSQAYKLPITGIKKRGNASNEEKFALSLCVYFIKHKLQIAHTKIAIYFGRKSHSFVNIMANNVHEIYYSKSPIHTKTVEKIKKIETLIDNALLNNLL